jgi:PAS domain S-box-containing protein
MTDEDGRIRVLLLEDNPGDALLFRTMLSNALETPFEIDHVNRLSDAVERLKAGKVDIALLDLSLPDSRGLETFYTARDQAPEIPIVVLSGSGSEETAIEAVQAGAQDYLVKGEINDRTLVRSIRYAIERRRAKEALRRERDLIARLMDTSPISITMVNREGALVFANERAEEVLGLSQDKITARTYNAPDWRITDFDGEPIPNSDLPFQQVMTTKAPVYDVRHAIEWPDGQRRLLAINGSPVFDESGEIDRVIFAIEDVTEQVRAEEERVAQLERELVSLEALAALPNTQVSARSYGLAPLRESQPNLFTDLVERYEALMDTALDSRVYRVEDKSSKEVSAMAERLGALRAGPRDVVDIHIRALRHKNRQSNPVKAEAYTEESRLIALELMGELASYYRQRCVYIVRPAPGGDEQAQTKGDSDG